MTDATEAELKAIVALCRGTASAYRKMDKATPYNVAAIVDLLGDRIAELLVRK